MRTRKEVHIADVGYLRLCTVGVRNYSIGPLRVLLVIDKQERCRLRFYAADALTTSGIQDLAAMAGLEVRGSWEQLATLPELRAIPGAASMSLTVFGALGEHPTMAYFGGSCALGVLMIVAGLIYVVLSHP